MKPIPNEARDVRSTVLSDRGLSITNISDGSRGHEMVMAKGVIAWICSNKLGMSLGQIAIICGWSGHSSAFDAINRVESELSYPDYHYGPKFKSPSDYAMDVYNRSCGKSGAA